MRCTSAGAPLKAKYAQLYKHKHGSRVHWNLFLFCWISFLMTGHNGGGKEKKGNSVWQAAESDAALLHKAAHMVIKPASGPLRRENKRMTKCSPCPLSFSWSLLPRLLRHSYASCREDLKKKKKKNKMEKDIKDISDDRWGGITKEKTSRDGSSSTKQNAKMQQKKKRCQSFASGFCQRGGTSDLPWSGGEPYHRRNHTSIPSDAKPDVTHGI